MIKRLNLNLNVKHKTRKVIARSENPEKYHMKTNSRSNTGKAPDLQTNT